ncbi:hypothetical protein CPB84DRAFT_1753799 [Gymnopilus junonius]|uniref:Uncharacterized protein n=1 Tax=Gymnopilus junonius TaxID=109634 RepID=A0A9P5N907_GYMJU|nr:hypothetical protein CPB84DRAFT_1753799 [Gymnopilus junonius]
MSFDCEETEGKVGAILIWHLYVIKISVDDKLNSFLNLSATVIWSSEIHINNLRKAETSRKVTVEDVSDEEDTEFQGEDLLEHGFFMVDEWGGSPDTGSDDDYSSESDKEEIAEEELKYHGHHTLPPDMAAKLKKEHQKKYGTPDTTP